MNQFEDMHEIRFIVSKQWRSILKVAAQAISAKREIPKGYSTEIE